MNNSVTVQSRDGTPLELYIDRLDEYADQYLTTLDDPEDIYKPPVFLGLLKYLYIHFFRPDKAMQHNANSILVNADAETIGRLWDKFTLLCYRYRSTPTILKFSMLTGLDRATFATWKDGKWRNASPEYSRTAQKMYQEAESALESKAVESNGIGAIFALKANFQWRETAPVNPETESIPMHDSAEQIAARHATARLPERPNLDFDDE